MTKFPLIYRLSIIIGLSLFCVAAGTKIGLRTAKANLSNYTYPFTSILGIDLGNKDYSDASQIIDKKIDEFLLTPIKIYYGDKKIDVLPEQIGIISPRQDILGELKTIKKNTDDLEFINNYFSDHNLKITGQIDKNQFVAKVKELFPEAFIAANNAYYVKENKQINVITEKAGQTVEFAILEEELKKSIESLNPLETKLIIKVITPNIFAADLEPHKEAVLTVLNKSITLKQGLKKINLKFINRPEWFTVEDNKLVLSATPFIKWFNEELRGTFENEKNDVKIGMDDQGIVTFDGFGKRGIKVQDQDLVKDISKILLTEETIVEVPVIYQNPNVAVSKNLKEKGINELLAVGYSDFRGSTTTRIFNIKVGLDKFNGVLIGPDEIFSFVDILGPVNGNTGYKKELVIKKDETKMDYGGGLCQVSSTAFRAALWAGFPIVERSPHTYAVSYYARPGGQGLDATIYPGSKDLKFKNDTPGHILLQTYTEGTFAFYNVYGTSDNRKVEINNYKDWGWVSALPTITQNTTTLEPGKQKVVEQPSKGFKASWDRTITKNGESNTETILSVYKPWAKKILIGVTPEEAEAAAAAENNESN